MKTLILATCALLAACTAKSPDKGSADTMASPAATASGGGEIHITTKAPSYVPGAMVGIKIHNATAHQYAFNPCTRSFEREGHGKVAEAERMCTMEAWLLEPNGTSDATVDLPAGVEPGTYTLSIDFSAQDSSGVPGQATSNTFEVK